MRKSVRVKNAIAKIIMAAGIFTVMAVGSNVDNFTAKGITVMAISSLISWIGYKLWQW